MPGTMGSTSLMSRSVTAPPPRDALGGTGVFTPPVPWVLRSQPCCGCLAWGFLKSSLWWSHSQGLVHNIIYKGTEAQIQQCVGPDGTVPLVQRDLGIGGLASPVPCVTMAAASDLLCPHRCAVWFSSPRMLPSSFWPPMSSLLWMPAPTWDWTQGHHPSR